MKATCKYTLAIVIFTVLTGGCTSRDTSLPGAASGPKSLKPSPTVEVAWFSATEDPLLRFVAIIKNPGNKAVAGIETEWVAYDANDAIVGSVRGRRPVVLAGSSLEYAGGAGGAHLSGEPARVVVTIVNPGKFVDEYMPYLSVSNIEIKPDFGIGQYEVRATVSTGPEEIASADLEAYSVLKNASGAIVGAEFWYPDSLPERIPPNSAFALLISAIEPTEKPTSAEVLAFTNK